MKSAAILDVSLLYSIVNQAHVKVTMASLCVPTLLGKLLTRNRIDMGHMKHSLHLHDTLRSHMVINRCGNIFIRWLMHARDCSGGMNLDFDA